MDNDITTCQNVTTANNYSEENRFTSACDLSKWIRQHLKMRYRIAFWRDGYGAEWIEPNTDGSTLLPELDSLLSVLAEYGEQLNYISHDDGEVMFKDILHSSEFKTTNFVEVYIAGRRYVFATWVDWWLLRGLENRI